MSTKDKLHIQVGEILEGYTKNATYLYDVIEDDLPLDSGYEFQIGRSLDVIFCVVPYTETAQSDFEKALNSIGKWESMAEKQSHQTESWDAVTYHRVGRRVHLILYLDTSHPDATIKKVPTGEVVELMEVVCG